MATRKSEWLASIKPILDRDEAKRDAKELAKELGDLLEIDIDTSPESLKKLTDEFNKQLSQMGKQPIVFSEKTLQGIVNQFANAVTEGFSKGANVGLEETFKLQLANLKKQKEALLKEQDDISRRVSNRSRIEKINKFEIENAHALPIDGDAVKQAEQLLDKMYEYADRISEIQAEQGKESEEYISTVLDAQEAYNEFLRMRKSLKKIKPEMPNDLKAAYDLFTGDEEDRYRASGGKTSAFDYDKYGGEIILDAFEEVSDVLINTDDQLDNIQKRLKEIDLQIESIVAQAKSAGAVDDAILGDSKDGLKTLKEIEDAYDRIAKKNKKTGGKALDGVSAAVDYVPGSESLTTLRNRYNTSLSSNEDWEVQYQWLVKFVKEYENYSAQIEAETDSIKRKNMKARQRQYTALYEELKPMAENAETMLRGIIDVSGGKQPSVVKDINKQDGDAGPTPEDVANAERIAALERQAREDAEAKAKAEAEAAEAAKQKRIEEEKAAKAAEKKRLADEASAEAQRKAAEEAERERQAKEASTAAERTGAYTGYRAIEPSDSSGKTKEDALLDWGAEYFSTDPKVAASYGENFFKEGSIIIGEITPKNPLVINANGLRWDEFDKMPKLKELFPGLLDLMKQPGYIGDDGQKYINDQARSAGYDSVILENVQDALDGDIKNYDLSTTIAVLDDKIVSLTGSMAQLEAGTNQFSNVVSPEIPSYYVGGQRGSKDSVAEVQDTGAAFKRLIDYIKNSGQEPKQFFDALAGGAQNVDDELKQILTTLDLFDSQGNLNLKSIESGFTNLGGMVSDTYTLIARGKDYLPKSQDLMPKLEDAKKMGANVGEILDVFEDETTGKIYELQRTMPGTIIPDNTDFLQATDEQILNLIADLQTLHKTGLYVDFGNDNILYDKEQGFSFIDLGTKFQEGQETVAGTAQELLKSIKPVFADNELFGNFESRLVSIANMLGVKIPQAAQNAEQAVDKFNSELKETENTATSPESAGGTGDASSAELEAAVTKTEALQDEVEQKNKELVNKDAEIARIQAESEAEKRALDDAKTTLQNDLDETRQQLEDAEYTRDLYDSAMNQLTEESNEKDRIIYDLREQLANVKTGVSEEQASVSSEELKNVLSSIVYNVKIAHDDNDKTANKIAIDESVLESTLKRVFTNVLNPQTEQNDSESKNEPWALEKTLVGVKEVLGNIQTNASKPDSIEVAPAKTDVGNVLATENTLALIKTAVESINKKVVKGTNSDTQKEPNSQNKTPSASSGSSSKTSSTKSLVQDYERLGKLSAQFAQDGDLETKAKKELLLEEIRRKRESLKLTMDENQKLREKYQIAYEAEKKLLEAEKQQKEINNQRKADAKSDKKRLSDAKKLAQREAMLGKAGNAVGRAENTWMSAIGIEGELPAGFVAEIDDYYQSLDSLRKKHQELKNSDMISEEQKKELITQTISVNKMTEEIGGLISQYQRLSGDNTEVLGASTLDDKATISEYEQALRQAVMTATNGKAQIKGFDHDTKTLTYTLKTGKHAFTEYTAEVRELDRQYTSTAGKTKKMETFLEATKRKMKELTSYFSGMAVFNRVGQELRRGIQYVREIDLALTELKKVTDETEESYDRFLKTAAKTADKVGSTVQKVVSSTADWARLGHSMEDAVKFAESTQILMNVSEFTDVSQATDSLISAVQAFGYTADTSMEVVNTLNIIGNNYAISTADLAQSLTKSSASLVAAGGNLAEAAALTATANAIIQDADSVGTALKTTSLRLRGTSVKVLEEEGLDTDGAVESTSKLRSQVLATSGVDILTDTGAYKSTYQILLEIAEVWDQITDDKARAGLLELLAGKRNSSVIAALLQNPEDLKAAYKDAMNAEGSALKENEKYLDSIQGKIDQFNNAMQTMWSDTLDSDVVKGFVELATQLVKIVDAIGPLNIALVGFFTYLEKKHGVLSNFFKPAEDGVEALKKQLKKAEQELAKATEADTQHGNKKTAQNRRDAEERVNILRKKVDDASQKPAVDPGLDALVNDRDSFAKEVDAMKAKREELQKAVESDSPDDMLKLIKIDTASIDDDIDTAQEKLNEAKQKLLTAQSESPTRKVNGGIRMNKDRDKHIADASKEIADIEKDLDALQQKKADTIHYAAQFDLAEMDGAIGEASNKLDGMTSAIAAKTAAQNADNIATGAGVAADQAAAGATGAKTAATWADVWAEMTRTGATGASVAATIKQVLATKLASSALVQKGLAIMGVTAAEGASIPVTTMLAGGFVGLAASIWSAITAMWTFMTTTPIGWILLAVGAVVALGAAFAAIHKSTEELQEELDGFKSALSDIRSELDSVNSELEKTNDRMEELLAKGNLTFEEQEELDKLRATNAELEHRKELLEDEEKHKAGIVGRQAAKVVDSKRDEIGTWLNGKSEDEEVLDDMADYREIKNKLDNASSLKDIEKYQKELDEKSAEIDEYIAVISEALKGVEYGDSAESDKALDYLAELRDQYSVARGTFNKTNYISRLFGDNASQELKDIKKDIEEAMKAGEEFDFSSTFDEDFKQNLYKMGVTVTDVKYYFQDLKKAEEEAQEFTTEDAIKAAAKLADKVESLKGAFEEFNETGIVTAKTLVELSETFGGMGDKWTDFVSIMTSGTASTEEAKAAINDLIETLITSALSGEKIETEQYVALWSQLTNMGVDNASELLNGIKEYSSIGEQIANEVLNGGKTIEEAISEYEKANNVLLTAEQKQVIAATYNAKSAKKKADTYNTQIQTLQTLASEYEKAKEIEDEWEEEVEDAADTKSGKILWWDTKTDADKQREANAILNEEAASANKTAISEQIRALYKEVFGNEGKAWFTQDKLLELQTYFEDPQNYDELSEEAQGTLDELGDKLGLKVDLEFESFDTVADKVQSVYSTLKDITTEYNTQGYLSLDNLQAFLNLSPEYLAVLKMEGGQLTINQSALQAMLETKLADAEATAVQTAITQLNALAERKKAIEVSNSAVAANQASIELGTYSGALSTVASDAIVAAGSVAAFNAALKGAQNNEFVSDEEWQQILTNFDNTVGLINSVRANLPTSFNNILDPGSKTTTEEEEDTWLDDQMEKFQKEMDYWENRIGANQSKYEQLQNEIDLLESKGQKANAAYYREQITLENQRRRLLQGQKKAAKEYLATLEEGSEEWWEVANTLNDIEGEIDSVTASIVDLQDAIDEINVYKFDEFNTRLDDITSKLGTIRDLIAPNGEDDWFDDEGGWTESGVAVLGSYLQELETYKQGYKNTVDEMAKYAEEYEGNEGYYDTLGIHSEQEYYDKVESLIDQQYDYAESISDTEQSVVDMYESNIDAVEEYTETLIDSYNDYIDSVKEALDAERDLYDFKKNVQKQSKDIATIERRIASLSGSTNASDVAERRKLEAELYESRESLNDTYYDHARSAQDEALDAERTAYEETMTKFVEGLRIGLDQATANMDEFLMSVTSMVTLNADTVLTKYQETELPLGDAITNPWKAAIAKIGEYDGDAIELMNKWTQGGFFDDYKTGVSSDLSSPWTAGSNAASVFKTSVSAVMEGVVSNISTNVKTASGELSKLYQQIKDTEKRAADAKVEVNDDPPYKPDPPQSPDPTPTQTPTTPKNDSAPTRPASPTRPTFKKVGDLWSGVGHTGVSIGKKDYNKALEVEGGDGIYYPFTNGNGYKGYIKKGEGYTVLGNGKMDIHSMKPLYQKYAKGTTGTKRDEWAITDEFGPELILHADPTTGRLQYLTKGSGVIPSELTEELMELGKIGVDGLMNTNKFGANINMISNAINKPEIVIDVENFLKVDRVDKDTLPQLEAMMDKKIDMFAKQLNYSIKKFSR